MRQVRKARIIFFILGVLLTCAIMGALGYFMITERDNKILELNAQKADGRMYAFARDIKADSEILPGDIIELETKVVNFATGGYYGTFVGVQKDAAGREMKDANGDPIEIWDFNHYVLAKDENGELKQTPMPITDFDLIGKVVKSDVYANQPVSDSVLYPDSDIPTESERFVEYNFIQLPSDLVENEYIDVRIQFPTGEDYLVLVGKKVIKYSPDNVMDIFLKLDEEEQLAMASAIVESYMQDGVRIYARKYTDAATQLYDEKYVDLIAVYEEGLAKAIENRNIVKARIKMVQEGLASQTMGNIDWEGDVPLATQEAWNGLSQEQKEALLEGIVTDESEITDEEISALLKIRVPTINSVRTTIASKDEKKIAYYRNYRMLEDKRLRRTYPVKDEMLVLIQKNPNLVQDIVKDFMKIAEINTRKDQLKLLEEAYEKAPLVKDYSSNEKTKDEIKSEIDQLKNTRLSTLKSSLESELKESQAARRSYINSLIGVSSSEEEY